MKESHLTPETLRLLLARDSTEEENRALLHQLAVCPSCYQVGGYILDLYQQGALSLSFCTVDIELARSRVEAPALLAKLERFSSAQQQGLVRDTSQFRSWGLCELLCAESERLAARDAGRGVEIAELAVLVASNLDEWQPAERSWLLELRAYAWAHLANARRVLGELRSAEKAFEQADLAWEQGAADAGDAVGYAARFYALKASLRREQRRFEEAEALIDLALDAEAPPSLRGMLLIAKAKLLEEMGRLDEAISLLRRTAPEVEAGGARLAFVLRHNLLDNLTKAGDCAGAAALLPEVRELAESAGDRLDLLRLRWVEARIAQGTGDTALAVSLFEEVRQQLDSESLGYDAALAALELALLYANEGQTAEVKRLAREAFTVFRAQDVRRESLGALTLLLQATEAETSAAELAAQIAACLTEMRHRVTVPLTPQDQ